MAMVACRSELKSILLMFQLINNTHTELNIYYCCGNSNSSFDSMVLSNLYYSTFDLKITHKSTKTGGVNEKED